MEAGSSDCNPAPYSECGGGHDQGFGTHKDPSLFMALCTTPVGLLATWYPCLERYIAPPFRRWLSTSADMKFSQEGITKDGHTRMYRYWGGHSILAVSAPNALQRHRR